MAVWPCGGVTSDDAGTYQPRKNPGHLPKTPNERLPATVALSTVVLEFFPGRRRRNLWVHGQSVPENPELHDLRRFGEMERSDRRPWTAEIAPR